MAARYLLDTNICIYIRQKKPPEVLDRFRQLDAGEAAISVVTYGELLFGAEKSARRADHLTQLHQLTSAMEILALPEAAAAHYAHLRASLETKGKMIGGNDLWIAAHAIASGLTLVTNNLKEFRKVPGLKVENWLAARR